MTRFSKTILLLGTAVLALSACSSDKGPGKLGTKNDIVVKNNGLPGAAQPATAAAKAPGEAFSSTVEQGTANPAPEVAAAEPVPAPDAAQTAAATAPAATDPSQPLPNNSPAMASAVAQQQAINAPVPSTTGANPVDESTAPPSETNPIDAMAPKQPVNTAVIPPVAPTVPTPAPAAAAPASSVYPTADYTAPTAPAPVPTPAYVPPAPAAASTVPYPLDKNAPYSPKAVAAAQAAAGGAAPATTAAPVASGTTDATTIRAAQAALAAKGGYTGPQTGSIDAEFLNALVKYQNANNLPVGGVNAETLKSLGVTQ